MTPDPLYEKRLRKLPVAIMLTTYLTRAVHGYVLTLDGERFMPTQKEPSPHIIKLPWWQRAKCALPWWGKQKWEEEVVARAALLSGVPVWQPISDWSYDEGWAIKLYDQGFMIAAGSRPACALAYIQYRIWEKELEQN